MNRRFEIEIIEEDIPEEFRDDLEGHIRNVIGEKFGLDAGIGFEVEEVR